MEAEALVFQNVQDDVDSMIEPAKGMVDEIDDMKTEFCLSGCAPHCCQRLYTTILHYRVGPLPISTSDMSV